MYSRSNKMSNQMGHLASKLAGCLCCLMCTDPLLGNPENPVAICLSGFAKL